MPAPPQSRLPSILQPPLLLPGTPDSGIPIPARRLSYLDFSLFPIIPPLFLYVSLVMPRATSYLSLPVLLM
ncbi:hypothetical protein KFK09_026231 [Dendrobium nobile]|uniref:Uncharacterized protein n=1 Tax=Dendrobium nobile TaxID=94219 RepID=A0A8T3A766_DENNO|nr:hypothetical protein KFK09_026231 [Dendrobium nobile]